MSVNEEDVTRHLRLGWVGLLVFVSLGIFLEALHGFKAGMYLDVPNEMRRTLWTLAHAHGTLLSIVNVAFALTLRRLPEWSESGRRAASACLGAALVLLPLGFFFAGAFARDGFAGLSIVLVPVGGALLFAAVFMTARACARADAGRRA